MPTRRSRAIGEVCLPCWFLLFLLGAACLLPALATLAADAERLGDLRGIEQASFNHDGSHVIVRPRQGNIGIWQAPAGPLIPGDLEPNTTSESYLLSADAKTVLIGFKDGHSRVFDAATAKAISPMLDVPLRAQLEIAAVFSPDGATLVLFAEKEAMIFNVRSGERIVSLPLLAGSNDEAPGSAAFTAGGAQCFLMDGSGVVIRYDTKDWKPIGKPMRHPAAEFAYDIAFKASDDGKWLATFDGPGENGPKGQLQVWDAVANKPIGKPLVAVNGLTGRFLGNNRILISPARGEASVRELPSMKVAYSLRPHDDIDGPSVDISPDQKWILSWGADHRLDLYDAASGKLRSQEPGSARISKVMIAPDSSGCYVVFDNTAFLQQGHHDNYVVKLSFPELKITDSLRILDYLLSASLSPDGKRVVVLQGATDQERLLFFDAARLKPLK